MAPAARGPRADRHQPFLALAVATGAAALYTELRQGWQNGASR